MMNSVKDKLMMTLPPMNKKEEMKAIKRRLGGRGGEVRRMGVPKNVGRRMGVR